MSLILPQRGRIRQAAAGGFTDPSDLFVGGYNGGWWDLTDTSTLFEEYTSPTTTPATGDPIGYVNDKSGVGDDLVASANDTTRPTLIAGGGAQFLRNSIQKLTAELTTTISSSVLYVAMVYEHSPAPAGGTRYMSVGVSGTSDAGSALYSAILYTNSISPSKIGSYRNSTVIASIAATASTLYLVEMLYTGSSNTIYLNTSSNSGTTVGGSFGIEDVRFAVNVQGANAETFKLYEGLIINKDIVASGEQADLRTYWNDKYSIY